MKMFFILLITITTAHATSFRIVYSNDKGVQGEPVFSSLKDANTEMNNLLKKSKWMKCDKWSEEAPTSIYNQVIEFFADETCKNFKITKVEKDIEGNEVTLYCHPKTFDFKCTDITQELADKKAKEEKDKSDLEALQEKYNDGTIKLDELVQFLKLKGI